MQDLTAPRRAWTPDDELWEQWRGEATVSLGIIIAETCSLLSSSLAPGLINISNYGPRYPAWPIKRLGVDATIVPELKSIVVMPKGATSYGTASAGLLIDEILMPRELLAYERSAANVREIELEVEIYTLKR